MISTSDLDARLRRHHEELVQLFSGQCVATSTRRRRTPRRLIVGLALAAVIAIAAPLLTMLWATSAGHRQVQIAGYTITAVASGDVPPRMTLKQAIADVEAFTTSHPLQLPHSGGPVSGLTAVGGSFVPDVQHVVGPCVNVFLPQPTSIWLVTVAAPAQSGWSEVRGGFLIADATGTLDGGDLLLTPDRNGPAVC